jgi:hypothetical protein
LRTYQLRGLDVVGLHSAVHDREGDHREDQQDLMQKSLLINSEQAVGEAITSKQENTDSIDKDDGLLLGQHAIKKP